MRRAALSLALALGAAAVVAAQDGPPADGTTEDRRRALAARVARLRGRALVQAPGAGGWTPVDEDALLSAGDRVRADDGPVELVVPGTEAAVRDRGTSGADRVVLAPDSRVVVGPADADARVRVEEGGVFASGGEGLRVQAGEATITVRGGDAEVEVSRGGDVTVTVHSGRVDVGASPKLGAARALSESERLTLDARGARVGKARPRAPAYVSALQETIGKLLRAPILFEPWPGEFEETWGERAAGAPHVTSTTKMPDPGADPGDRRPEVRLGRTSERGGVWVHERGARVRIRYRLSAPAPLQLDLIYATSGAGPRRVRSAPFQGRAGAWDEVEFRCEELGQVSGDPAATGPGDVMMYLSLYAGTEAQVPAGLRLDVARIVVFTPKAR